MALEGVALRSGSGAEKGKAKAFYSYEPFGHVGTKGKGGLRQSEEEEQYDVLNSSPALE